MSILKDIAGNARRVSDMVREMFPRFRTALSEEDRDLAVHLRGNERLYNALTAILRSRIQGRDQLPVPSDPLTCKSILERNNELRWMLSKLEYLYRSPANAGTDVEGAENVEQPVN